MKWSLMFKRSVMALLALLVPPAMADITLSHAQPYKNSEGRWGMVSYTVVLHSNEMINISEAMKEVEGVVAMAITATSPTYPPHTPYEERLCLRITSYLGNTLFIGADVVSFSLNKVIVPPPVVI